MKQKESYNMLVHSSDFAILQHAERIQNMLVKVIKIGNSRGIIIPSPFLKKLNSDKLILEESETGLTIRPARPVREGWEKAAMKANKAGDDAQILDFPNEFDDEEWSW